MSELMNSVAGRLGRVIVGFLLVVYAARLSWPLAFVPLIVGTVMGVLGTAGVCFVDFFTGRPSSATRS
jgi:hypothetical protein